MYIIKKNILNVDQYQQLRNTTEWIQLPDSHIKRALRNDLFSVVVLDNKKAIGMGRVIGDGAIYFYLQDIIIHPDYRRKGVGKLIMTTIEQFLQHSIQGYAFIGLMAAQGTMEFYLKSGFAKRKDDAPGMYKIINKNEKPLAKNTI